MVLPIIAFPDEILTKRCETVKRITKDLVQLGKDMLETLKAEGGLGLAASQVGVLSRVIVITVNSKPLLMYNPIIASQSTTRRAGKEGCLSFTKGLEYSVKRPTAVKVKYQDINGKLKFISLEDFDARVFYHEYAHLQGLTMDKEGEKVE